MEPDKSDIANDVLHSENHTRLSAEEIAKAVAHHNRNHNRIHGGDVAHQTDAKTVPAKKR